MKSVIAMLALVLMVGCSGANKQGGGAAGKKGSRSLCKAFSSCHECIAGLQRNRGISYGQAQSECTLASSGCWVTWKKPIKCD